MLLTKLNFEYQVVIDHSSIYRLMFGLLYIFPTAQDPTNASVPTTAAPPDCES